MNNNNYIKSIHYNKRLFEDMLKEYPTSIQVMPKTTLLNDERKLLFTYLLKDNKNINNLYVFFINHHAFPNSYGIDDTYIKIFDSFDEYKDYDSLKEEWCKLDCPPIRIKFSLDIENTQRIDFTDDRILNCKDPTDIYYQCGFVITTFLKKENDSVCMIIENDIIDEILLKMKEYESSFYYNFKTYS